jgi:bacterioferritin
MTDNEPNVSRERLIELLNEDLVREYQAVIAYVVYSQVIKGAAYMNIAAELEKHAQEPDHRQTNRLSWRHANCHCSPGQNL